MLEWWTKNFGSCQLGDERLNPFRDRQWGCSGKSCGIENTNPNSLKPKLQNRKNNVKSQPIDALHATTAIDREEQTIEPVRRLLRATELINNDLFMQAWEVTLKVIPRIQQYWQSRDSIRNGDTSR